MGCEQLKRLIELEKENQRFRRAVSDLTLDKLILGEAAKGMPLAGRRMEHSLRRARPQWADALRRINFLKRLRYSVPLSASQNLIKASTRGRSRALSIYLRRPGLDPGPRFDKALD